MGKGLLLKLHALDAALLQGQGGAHSSWTVPQRGWFSSSNARIWL